MRKGVVLIFLFLLVFVSVVFSLVSAQDSFSPFGTSEVSVVVDGDAPIVTILGPENITYNNATPTLFNFSVFDLTLDSVWHSFDVADNVTYSGEFYLDLAEGEHYLRVYANDSFNRVNFSEVYFSVNNSISFCGNSFCSIDEDCNSCSIDCGACPSPGGGGGGGGGGSSIGSKNSFLLDKNLIVFSLVKSVVSAETLTITNLRNKYVSFSLREEGLERFIGFEEPEFVLPFDESKEVVITFLAKESELIGLYTGKIFVETERDRQEINVVLQVVEREALFDIISELESETLNKEQQISATITMTDVGSLGESNVFLEYFIKDFEDNEIKIGEEVLQVDGSLQIEREFYLPTGLVPGKYVFYTKLVYGESVATSANVFSLIGEGKVFGRIFILILIILLALAIFLLRDKKRRKRAKKWAKKQSRRVLARFK